MRSLVYVYMLATAMIFSGCTDDGEPSGTGNVTLVGPAKDGSGTITLNKELHVKHVVGPFGSSIDCIEKTNSLIVFSVILPGKELPAQTTTYNIVDSPGIEDLGPNEVELSYADLSGGNIIEYISEVEGKTLTIQVSGNNYNFTVSDVRMVEGVIYTDGPATHFIANGSFQFSTK